MMGLSIVDYLKIFYLFFILAPLQECAKRDPANTFEDPQVLALVRAARSGHTLRMEHLVKNGADPNAKGKGGVTPLRFVEKYSGSERGFEKLLILGADPNARDDYNGTVLYRTVENKNPAYLKLALQHGADPNVVGRLPYSGVLSNSLIYSDQETAMEFVRPLVERGADVNYQNKITGMSPAMNACGRCFYHVVYYLLENGANPLLKMKFGFTLNHYIQDEIPPPHWKEQVEWRKKVIDWMKEHHVWREEKFGERVLILENGDTQREHIIGPWEGPDGPLDPQPQYEGF